MQAERIRKIFNRHGTDKGTRLGRHSYHIPYSTFLMPYLNLRPCRLLEIGTYRGASLRSWLEIFPWIELTGLDINPRAMNRAPKECQMYIGDQGDKDCLESMAEERGPWDVIIDDGSHRIDHQQDTLTALWPHLNPGGLYVIEDLVTSVEEYWTKEEVDEFNPGWQMNTIDWLMGRVKDQIGKSKIERRQIESWLISFYSEGCFIVKSGDISCPTG